MSMDLNQKVHADCSSFDYASFFSGRAVRVTGILLAGVLAAGLSGCGSSSDDKPAQMLQAGQSVTLENPNGGLSHLTSGPGMMSASVSEEDREQSICTAQPGTHGTVEEIQIVDTLPYVKVAITDGDCAGKSGWTTRTNIKL